MLFFLLSFLVIGAGIKYMDAAFDDGTVSKKLAILIAPVLAIIGWYTMMVDEVAATILIAVLLGVLLTFKIDNIAHILGFAVIAPIIFFTGVQFMLIPLILLVVSGIIDEVGNDYVDKKKQIWGVQMLLIIKFFEHRWTLKVAILALVIINMFPWYFFVAMILFDYAYLSVSMYSDLRQGNQSSHFMKKALATIGVFNK
jgi:hypothetical protein